MQYVYMQLLLIISVIFSTFAIPSEYSHFISIPADEEQKENNVTDNLTPEIYEMHISSQIRHRFAKTMIRSKVRNSGESAQETTFFVVLPEAAFISGFIMETDKINYTAYLKRKEEAQKQYDEAKSSGLTAAHIATNFRDSNRFMVSVNIKPQAKAVFYLTYEELLIRKQGSYEHVINMYPGQPIQNLNVLVSIHEKQKLTQVEALPISSGKEISNDDFGLNPNASIVFISTKKARIEFSPTLEKQKQLSRVLKTAEKDGLAGQLVIRYDVERDSSGGQVLIKDGYFVHFFAPSGFEPLPKHVIFLLDTSSSMEGNGMEQLKEAMALIFDELQEQDLFQLVEFNTNVKVWNIDDISQSVWFPISNEDFDWNTYDEDDFDEIGVENFVFPNASVANPDNIKKAKRCITEFKAEGATDIYSGFKVALHLLNTAQRMTSDNITYQPIIIFLTDGVPNIRYSDSEQIRSNITELNINLKASIFALSFGDEADKYFTKWVSHDNYGFSRHIYPDLDSSLQLKNFYKSISSPLLKNVKFKYSKSVTSLTVDTYPIYFDGRELMVAGFCGSVTHNFSYVTGYTNNQRSNLIPIVQRSISSMERIWAYLTIKQLLDKKEASDEDRNKFEEKATELSLKYSFVTPFTSLVVLQPNASYWLDREEASADDGPSLYVLPSTSPDLIISANLEENLPWLRNFVNQNGTVSLSTGSYKIASLHSIAEDFSCPKTPTDETTGNCKLLEDCPQVYASLTDFDIFVKYSCILQSEYAGICCPSSI